MEGESILRLRIVGLRSCEEGNEERDDFRLGIIGFRGILDNSLDNLDGNIAKHYYHHHHNRDGFVSLWTSLMLDMLGGVLEDASLPHLAPSAATGSKPTVLQVSETSTNNPYILPAPEATTDVPSTSIPVRPVPLPENSRQSIKRKAGAKSGEEASRDKLDPTVLGKLSPTVAIAATSVHKYWTSAFEKTADTAEVTELVKLTEMYTSCSHVLNCELYKMLEMKVDELHSAIGEDEDVEAMRAENKHLRARLVFSEDARTRATYDVTKAQTIQKACVDARKKVESQLKSCQSMIYVKDKELTEALSELAKAKGLLAKLGAPGYAEP
ncbi:hypothetical protein Fot_23981 [Forsythia ovata]|uniref:Uncharacterized protein n=1 Tax=Forsythia ovata TaxID=205694 RepID=A0ABD1U5N5_9LAMI